MYCLSILYVDALLTLCRCDGRYKFYLHQHNFSPKKFSNSKEEHVRFGFLTADHLDGDKVAYARQASEGIVKMELCNSSQTKPIQIEADMLYVFNQSKKGEETIYLGLDETNVAQIIKLYPATKKADGTFFNTGVTFVLKYSYFDNLHRAIDQLPWEVLEKIMPNSISDFTPPVAIDSHSKSYMIPHIEEFVTEENRFISKPQMHALHKIIYSEKTKAPVLVVGSFGTGKTRVLAHAAYQILFNDKQAKVLICAHHQASADSFIQNYFGRMIDSVWRCQRLIRLYPKSYSYRVQDLEFQEYYMTIGMLRKVDKKSIRLVVTTFYATPSLLEYPGKNHFTHILLDEGAQTREPETIAPLCLANKNTKIAIVGDHKQVRCIFLVYKTVEVILCMKCVHLYLYKLFIVCITL